MGLMMPRLGEHEVFLKCPGGFLSIAFCNFFVFFAISGSLDLLNILSSLA